MPYADSDNRGNRRKQLQDANRSKRESRNLEAHVPEIARRLLPLAEDFLAILQELESTHFDNRNLEGLADELADVLDRFDDEDLVIRNLHRYLTKLKDLYV